MNFPLIALLVGVQAGADDPVAVTVEPYIALRRLSGVRAAPRDTAVAFTVREADLRADLYRSRVYVWTPADGARLATPPASDTDRPRWSPDGDWLAVISTDDGTSDSADGTGAPQLWLIGDGGRGPPQPLARLDGGVLDYAWAPDGSIYAVTGPAPPQTRKDPLADDGAHWLEHGAIPGRELWSVSVPDGAAKRVWSTEGGIADLAIAPDGRHLVFTSDRRAEAADYPRHDLWILDLETHRPRRLTDRPGLEHRPVWSPDGRNVVFLGPQRPGVARSQVELLSVPAGGGPVRSLTDAFDRSVLRHAWSADGRLIFAAAIGMYTHLFQYSTQGGIHPVTTGAGNYGDFDSAPDGSSVYAVRESASEGSELWQVEELEARRLTSFNLAVAGWRLPRQEVVRWSAPDGLSIEGLLVYPLDYESGRRYPLIVNTPGSARGRARNVLDQPNAYPLFAARGYAVLAPNHRGSIGYGETFGTSSAKDPGDDDLRDLMAGVDHVIAIGVADSARLGLYGSSFHGHLTPWALAQTPRFGAAVLLSGVRDLIADYRGSRLMAWEYDALTRLYGDRLSAYLGRSPIRFVASVTTPLLIVGGASDPDEFRESATELYRELASAGRRVELVDDLDPDTLVPGPGRQVELFFRQVRWFDRHLRSDDAASPEFYLAGEWAPGPDGWEVRLSGDGVEGRRLEVVLEFRVPPGSSVESGLDIDLDRAVWLLGPTGLKLAPGGPVTAPGSEDGDDRGELGLLQIVDPGDGGSPQVTAKIAFELPAGAGEYWLHVGEFPPVRIWVPRT